MRSLLISCALAVLTWAAATVPTLSAELAGTFETNDLSQFPHVQVNPGNSIRLIESPVRYGRYAARFEAKRPGVGTSDYRRAEVVEPYGRELPQGKRERWYGGSFYLPNDYEWDDQNVIIFQMHESDSGSHPNFTLNIGGDRLGDIRLQRNKWYDFVMHARWSNTTDGFLEAWVDGIKIENRQGVKTSELVNNFPPYAKWGIYKYAWRGDPTGSSVDRVVVIWDHCMIGTTREQVAVPGGTSPQPPTISVTVPSGPHVAPADVTLSATAADSDGTISKVEFFVGGVLKMTDSVAPYAWPWNDIAAGTYSVTARATDSQGLSTTTMAHTLTVQAGTSVPTPPTITLSVPSGTHVAPADLTLSASAADSDGTISKVEFFVGGVLEHTELNAPYTWPWNDISAGSYSVAAKATDAQGLSTTTAAMNLTVQTSDVSTPPGGGSGVSSGGGGGGSCGVGSGLAALLLAGFGLIGLRIGKELC